MSNLNTNYENMKKYKFETLFIKKYNFKHENTCLKHDLWKISSPTVILTVIVQCSFPGALAPCELKLWPRLHQWAKTPGFWWNTPGENAANSLWTESLGRWPGNVGKSCGCCDDPCTPRDLNNSHTCHPTYPNIRPKDLVHRESRHHPRGVSTDT